MRHSGSLSQGSHFRGQSLETVRRFYAPSAPRPDPQSHRAAVEARKDIKGSPLRGLERGWHSCFFVLVEPSFHAMRLQ